ECAVAGCRAVQYYLDRTGRQEEGEVLKGALAGVTELRRWAAELERGKVWLEEQWKAWQGIAEEREKTIQEQKQWIGELEEGKKWLDDQWQRWQVEAEQRAKTIVALERDKASLEEQWHAWQESTWGRLGVRLGALKREVKNDRPGSS
ncbi:MAG: hypothetical protein ACRERD_10865, partial [Candidatus Binatia bacterium]